MAASFSLVAVSLWCQRAARALISRLIAFSAQNQRQQPTFEHMAAAPVAAQCDPSPFLQNHTSAVLSCSYHLGEQADVGYNYRDINSLEGDRGMRFEFGTRSQACAVETHTRAVRDGRLLMSSQGV